jgi:galactokinase
VSGDPAPGESTPDRPGPGERSAAFAPGRVNLIGEHTDYNQGLALPFAIAEGVIVRAETAGPDSPEAQRIYANARDLGESDEFELSDIPPAKGWRAFVRGVVAELSKAGCPLMGARLEIGGDLEQGAGLSSSAALEVALCLALADLSSRAATDGSLLPAGQSSPLAGRPRTLAEEEERPLHRIAIARLCARVENEWVGAQTGMLDQLASLYGEPDMAVLIDFRTLQIDPVPLRLEGWRFVLVDSGERHANAGSGYNERRAECRRACELLSIDSLRDASTDAVAKLPQPLRARAEHVLGENERVGETVASLRAEDLPAVGALLNASHASLRDLYEVSTPTVERAVGRLREDGAAGARLMGGGFGGSVLGLFAPGIPTPPGAREVRPGPGAHVLAND